jgi:GMP reductase
MRIENEVKLDFSDVLIRPKRSTLASRKEVDLTRNYTFRHSKYAYNGVPIMAANMDGVGAQSLKQLSKCTTFVRVNNQYNKVYAG